MLLEEANAETEEDFYNAYNVHGEANRLKEQLANIETQLGVSGPVIYSENMTENELLKKAAESESVLSSIDEKTNNLINEKASLVNKTERLLTDETYGRKIQLFEMKKAELGQLAKKWAARKAIAEAINQNDD